eukprot:jgi/Orpsp1_1/1189635/evm.model.d7180000073377.1
MKGSLIYIKSNSKVNSFLSSIRHIGVGNISKSITVGGFVACVDGYTNLYIEDLYSEDLYGGNSVGAFILTDNASIILRNIELHNIYGSNYGGLLLHSFDENPKSKFKVVKGIFTDFYQNFEKSTATFIWSKNIEIEIEDCEIKNIYGKNS